MQEWYKSLSWVMPYVKDYNRLITSYRPSGKVVFQDRFDEGFCGWVALIDGPRKDQESGLREPTLSADASLDSSLALQISPKNLDNSEATVCKRIALPHVGKIGYEMWYVWKAETESWIKNMKLWFDVQTPEDNPKRCCPAFLYVNATSAVELPRKWQINTGALTTPTFVDFPNNEQRIPWNMWGKYNWNYIKVIFDLKTLRYVKLISNNREWDLSDYSFGYETADPTIYSILNVLVTIRVRPAQRVYLWINNPILTVED